MFHAADNSVEINVVEFSAAENSGKRNDVEFSVAENSVDIYIAEFSSAENSRETNYVEFSAAENSEIIGELVVRDSGFTCLVVVLTLNIFCHSSNMEVISTKIYSRTRGRCCCWAITAGTQRSR